ncbi:MAG: sulfite exporter TauE/SafE family protein, partial [Dehalococcoidia bacterium]
MISALSLGLLTATSPCPMATNIAAIAYIGQGVTDRKYTIITTALYTAGRMLAYSVLGVLIIKLGLEVPGVALLLQNTGERILGPILIVVGAILLNINRLRLGNRSANLSS